MGLTGLPGNMVRPRWQPEPANIPDFGVDWCAFGIQRKLPDTYAQVQHDSTGEGTDKLQRHETVEILLSFYGPNADMSLELLREGLQIAQNREVLQQNSMGLVETGEAIVAPSIVKDRWLYRVDMTLTIRRQIKRVYPVLNLLSAEGDVITEPFTDSFEVTS